MNKFLIVVTTIIGFGCSDYNSPENLKKMDAANVQCKADCAPRKMSTLGYGYWYGYGLRCRCEVNE